MENLPNRTARPTADQDDEDAIDVRFLTDAVQSLRATALVLLELEACDREHRVLTMRGVEHMLWEERSRG